ncbi:cyclin-D1-1-like [Quillaja saponaria]|uniref:B-like cyclin n=1 Tax=Quillaja saponaria TaxID=32244 RepID=A0AAD7KUU0_QUISA|nr:cyclin-D1-1-like [Quillaja saponaria]
MSQSPDPSDAASLFCGENADELIKFDAETWIHSFSSLHSYAPPSDETTIGSLIETETHHMPYPDYPQRCPERSIDVTARQDSINWILKVHAYYRFQPVTAFLSVNYFDRFLSIQSLPQPRGWRFQLLSVACLSLAAKMEEPQIPFLLDLQVSEPKFIFEPKTVQRMELWVMANLDWRLRSVTPFDYLHYFISMFPSSSNPEPELFNQVLSSASDLILSTTRVIDFLGFAPSTIAAAAVLCSGGECHSVADGSQVPVLFHERVNKEMVRSCRQLMEVYMVDTCPEASHEQRAELAPPSSPVGVLDAAVCGSCDTRSEYHGSASQAEPLPRGFACLHRMYGSSR